MKETSGRFEYGVSARRTLSYLTFTLSVSCFIYRRESQQRSPCIKLGMPYEACHAGEGLSKAVQGRRCEHVAIGLTLRRQRLIRGQSLGD